MLPSPSPASFPVPTPHALFTSANVFPSKLCPLQVSPRHVAALVVRQPGLLTHNPATLAARLDGLGQLLKVTPHGCVRLAITEPGLLALRHEDVEARLQVRLYKGGCGLKPPFFNSKRQGSQQGCEMAGLFASTCWCKTSLLRRCITISSVEAKTSFLYASYGYSWQPLCGTCGRSNMSRACWPRSPKSGFQCQKPSSDIIMTLPETLFCDYAQLH